MEYTIINMAIEYRKVDKRESKMCEVVPLHGIIRTYVLNFASCSPRARPNGLI